MTRRVCNASPALRLSIRTSLDRHRGKQRRPLGIRIGRQQPDAHIAEPGSGQEARDLLLRKPEPDVAHLLLIFLAIVRQHVDDQHAPARAYSTRPTSASARGGDGE